MKSMFRRVVSQRTVPGTLAAAALLASGCSGSAPPPREPLQFSDVETVFFGFNNPTERIGDRVMRLYGDDSVPLTMAAGQADESTLHVEVRSEASEEQGQGTPGVRCFNYRLDHETQQAHLEDLTSSSCSNFPSDEEA